MSKTPDVGGEDHLRGLTRRIVVETFDRRMNDAEHAMPLFRKHAETVRRAIPDERLLIYEADEGWDRLGNFLGVAVPETPYPKVNTAEHFHERWREQEGG